MKKNQNLKSFSGICFLCSILLFTSCSSKSLPNSSSSINLNTSIADNGTSNDEIMLVASIPNEFKCFGEIYVKQEQTENSTFGHMIGYLINENELDFWKNKDNEESTVYALDIGNGVFRYTLDDYLKNRFELYTQDETYDCLAIKDCSNNFILYCKLDIA